MVNTGQTHVLHVHDTSAKRKTGQLVFELMEEEYKYITDVLHLKMIGICGDAGGDEKRGRLLFLQKYPSMLITDCWSHQVRTIYVLEGSIFTV